MATCERLYPGDDLVTAPAAVLSASQDPGAFDDDLEDDWEFNHDEPLEPSALSPEPSGSFGSDSEPTVLAGPPETESVLEKCLGFDGGSSADTGSTGESFGLHCTPKMHQFLKEIFMVVERMKFRQSKLVNLSMLFADFVFFL